MSFFGLFGKKRKKDERDAAKAQTTPAVKEESASAGVTPVKETPAPAKKENAARTAPVPAKDTAAPQTAPAESTAKPAEKASPAKAEKATPAKTVKKPAQTTSAAAAPLPGAKVSAEKKTAPAKAAQPDKKAAPAKAVPSDKKTVAAKKAGDAKTKDAANPAKTGAQKAAPAKSAAPAAKNAAPEHGKEEIPAVDTNLPVTGRFEIKKSRDDRYVFNLYAVNKVIVATSQVYSSAQRALQGIQSVIANAEKAPVEDQTVKGYTPVGFPKWELYEDKGGQFRFRLNAPNGSCICHSQGYTTKANCKNGIESIIRSSRNAEIDKAYLTKEKE